MRDRWARIVSIMLLAFPGVTAAQAVRGEIVSSRDSSVISGAVVQLLDSSGAVIGRALSDEQGRFRLAGRTFGAHRVRATYIGFRPITTGVLLQGGQDAGVRLSLQVLPQELTAVNVSARQVCRPYADAGVAAELWDQARTAFAATRLTAAQRRLHVTTLQYERELDVDGKVLSQSVNVRSGPTTQPWVSLSADSLRRLGYVIQSGDGSRTYHAPDLDVLASDVFLQDHCLRLAGASPGEVVLAFEPTRERSRIADIAGTVRLDRRTYELRGMDFRYVNVSRADEKASTGGEMAFLHVSRIWTIAGWNIRMPIIERRLVPGRVPEERVTRRKVAGGETLIVSRGRDTLWARPPVILLATVLDSVSGRPIARARVEVRGTELRAESDDEGRVSIAGLIPGAYTLRLASPGMRALGAAHDVRAILSPSGEQLRLALPTEQYALDRVCPLLRPGDGVVAGRVSARGGGTAPANLAVLAEWSVHALHDQGNAVVANRNTRSVETKTRSDGTFTVCGVPTATTLFLRTAWDERGPGTGARIPDDERVLRADLVVDPPFGAYRGTVIDATDHRPLNGVEVVLPLAKMTMRTASDGRVHIDSIPGGRQDIVFRRDGYTTAVRRHSFARDTVVSEHVLLAKVGARIVASETADTTALVRPGMQRRSTAGHLITREQLERSAQRRLSDVLATVPGLRIIRSGKGAWASTRRGGASPNLGAAAQQSPFALVAECYCDIYLDGSLLYARTDERSTPSIDLDMYPPSSLEAVEFFNNAGQVPAEFNRGGAACGVLLLWSRKGDR